YSPSVCRGSKSIASSSTATDDLHSITRRQAPTLLPRLLAPLRHLIRSDLPAHLSQTSRRQPDLIREPMQAVLIRSRRIRRLTDHKRTNPHRDDRDTPPLRRHRPRTSLRSAPSPLPHLPLTLSHRSRSLVIRHLETTLLVVLPPVDDPLSQRPLRHRTRVALSRQRLQRVATTLRPPRRLVGLRPRAIPGTSM